MGGFLFSLWKITAKANTEPPDYPGVFFTPIKNEHKKLEQCSHGPFSSVFKMMQWSMVVIFIIFHFLLHLWLV